MLRINFMGDVLNISKHLIEPMVRGTVLEFMLDTNTTEPDSSYQFTHILDMISYTGISYTGISYTGISHAGGLENDWMIFKNYLEKKSSFHQSPIVSNYTDSINLLIESIAPNKLMNRMRYQIIPNNIPHIIQRIGCQTQYEQLIFYEYIYCSPNTSYVSKAIIMLENKYNLIMELLEDGMIAPSTNARDNLTTDMIVCMNNYLSEHKLFKRFINYHKNWLEFDSNMWQHNCMSIYQHRTIVDKIKFHQLFHLNKLYESDHRYVEDVIQRLIPMIDWTITINVSLETQKQLYGALDLFVRLMECNSALLDSCNKKSKIFVMWMNMSRISHRANPKDHSMREIKLSRTIYAVLSTVYVAFAEMGYVLVMDRLDMFKILTRNIVFDTIPDIIYTMMPPNILQYIVGTLSSTVRNLIEINIYDLQYRTPDDIRRAFNIVRSNTSTQSVDYIMNQYNYIECPYQIMYWDYLHLFKTIPGFMETVLSIFQYIDNLSNHFLDTVIIKIVLMNEYPQISTSDSIDRALDKLLSDPMAVERGPDFKEICDELLRFGIGDLSYLNHCIRVYEEMMDRVI